VVNVCVKCSVNKRLKKRRKSMLLYFVVKLWQDVLLLDHESDCFGGSRW
jgi:hypothetical protein